MLSRLSLRLRGRTARLLHAPAPTGATPPGRTPAARPPGNASILLFARASTSHLAHVDRRLESTSAALAAAVTAAFPGPNATPAQQRPPLTSPFPSFAPPPPPRRPEKAADAPSLETTAGAAEEDRRDATPIQSSTPYAPVAELDTPRKYHFEVRGADAKRAFDRSKIKCMCHEVSEVTTAFVGQCPRQSRFGGGLAIQYHHHNRRCSYCITYLQAHVVHVQVLPSTPPPLPRSQPPPRSEAETPTSPPSPRRSTSATGSTKTTKPKTTPPTSPTSTTSSSSTAPPSPTYSPLSTRSTPTGDPTTGATPTVSLFYLFPYGQLD